MDANEMLVRMSHRGGVGCCPASGDGAGEFFSVWLFDGSFSACCGFRCVDMVVRCLGLMILGSC
jgi:hypothetical protein